MALILEVLEVIHNMREKKENQSLAEPELPKLAHRSILKKFKI